MGSHLSQPGALCVLSVLCFTSLSDFKGVLALLQPLATQDEHCQPGKVLCGCCGRDELPLSSSGHVLE